MEGRKFLCEVCGASYSLNKYLRRHIRDRHSDIDDRLTCTICKKSFTSMTNLSRHRREVHNRENYNCKICSASFKSNRYLKGHEKSCHEMENAAVPVNERGDESLMSTEGGLPERRMSIPSTSSAGPSWRIDDVPLDLPAGTSRREEDNALPQGSREEEYSGVLIPIESAFKTRVRTYAAYDLARGDLQTCLNNMTKEIVSKLQEGLSDFTSLKFNLFVECKFINMKAETAIFNFKSKNEALYRDSDVMTAVKDHVRKIVNEFEESTLKGSGWSYLNVHRLELRINKHNPLHGSRYFQLPFKFKYSKSIVNIRNYDDFCFKYCILSKFIHSDQDCWTKYQNRSDLDSKYDWSCIEFPVKLKDISRFERRNNISINVFGIDEKQEIIPLKVCDVELEDHRDLLYVTNDDADTHFCCISNFDAFIRSQMTASHRQIRVCKRCFAYFSSLNNVSADDRLREHKELCMHFKPIRCEIPKETVIKFHHFHHSQKLRFVIYADFECILKPISGCENDTNSSWTARYQKHVPFSYCYLLKDSQEEYSKLKIFRGENAATHFIQALLQDVKRIDRILYGNRKPMLPLTPEQEESFNKSTVCYICKKENFTGENYKVRDHCYTSGQYRGPAHRECNLNFKDQTFIPVIVHNLSSYDSHFIVKELSYDGNRIDVIPNTEEKYISLSKNIPSEHLPKTFLKLRFLDSFRFMASSLARLAANLPKDKFNETRKYFHDKFDLVTRKGIFPYDHVTSLEVLKEDRLPPKTAFYNKLNEEDISDEDYDYAVHVWKEFQIQNLGEYSDLYLKTDTLILSDIFENFRNMCLQTYDLDCAYYFTAPGLAWNAMLKCTEVEMKLIEDVDMIMMVESGIRGGICQCITRYAASIDHRLNESRNNETATSIYYVDANNLYGWAMSQYLPYDNFKWLSKEDIEALDVTSISDTSDVGYIVEADLEYPDDLHIHHSDLPFCAEMKIPPGSKTKKLLTTLENKEHYVVHYRVLKQALEHGLKLTKVHRAIEFSQSPWLKKYIDLNNSKRKEATNEFEKDFFKLMNNAVFGKTMENIRNRLDYRLVCNAKSLEKLLSKSNFLDRTIYGENLVGVHLAKTRLVFNKPIYVGMSILDISKSHMYNFHYSIMKPFYEDRIKLCYMDTDSFIYSIKTENLYAELRNVVGHLDTSIYPTDHVLYSPANKGVLGMMKDESLGKIIEAFVGLRAKMYALKFADNNIKKKLKGIKKSVINKHINFQDYVDCLWGGNVTYSKNRFIVSDRHDVYTVCMNKKTLDCHDDKRHIMDDGVNTLPYGHVSLRDGNDNVNINSV